MNQTLLLVVLLAAGPAAPPAAAPGTVYSSHLMVDQDVVVSARIIGIVDAILVERGTVVKKGQPLANLDSREADADVRQTKEEMELRKAELVRAQALSASSVTSQSDLDTKRAQAAVAAAAHEKAKVLRDYTVIRAPFDGVVTEKYARVGQKVIDVGKEPLFKITAFEPLLARIYVPEKELLNMKKGTPVEVLPTSFPGSRASGWVEYISPTVDAGSGTFEVIVRVKRDPAQKMLRPGVAVSVRLPRANGS